MTSRMTKAKGVFRKRMVRYLYEESMLDDDILYVTLQERVLDA